MEKMFVLMGYDAAKGIHSSHQHDEAAGNRDGKKIGASVKIPAIRISTTIK